MDFWKQVEWPRKFLLREYHSEKSLKLNRIERVLLLKKSTSSISLWHYPKLVTADDLLNKSSYYLENSNSNVTYTIDDSLYINIYISEYDGNSSII